MAIQENNQSQINGCADLSAYQIITHSFGEMHRVMVLAGTGVGLTGHLPSKHVLHRAITASQLSRAFFVCTFIVPVNNEIFT
jgi:hypothetical protein